MDHRIFRRVERKSKKELTVLKTFLLSFIILVTACGPKPICNDVPIVGYCFEDETGRKWSRGKENTPAGSVQEKDIPFGLGAYLGFLTCVDCFSDGEPTTGVKEHCATLDHQVCE